MNHDIDTNKLYNIPNGKKTVTLLDLTNEREESESLLNLFSPLTRVTCLRISNHPIGVPGRRGCLIRRVRRRVNIIGRRHLFRDQLVLDELLPRGLPQGQKEE